MFPLQYAPAEAGAVTTAADGSADPQLPPPYCCPVTHLRCDRHPFVALRPCGHVLAERAVREVAQDGTCPICSKPFEEEDAVPLLPTEEQEARLRELLPGRRKQRRGKKEGCKGKGGAAATANDGEEEQQQQQSDGGQQQQPVRGEQQDVKRQRHERQETAGGAAQAGA